MKPLFAALMLSLALAVAIAGGIPEQLLNTGSRHETISLSAVAAMPTFTQTVAVAPDPVLTPGQTRTTNIGEICSTPTSTLRHWDRARDDRILTEYGLPTGPHPQFEIDHSIPLCLGGADSDANLWPEPRRAIEPVWNADRKDEIEARLCSLVCSDQIDVIEAQRAISEDWTAAYQRFVREPR
jgi:hypothetical protein